MGLPKFFTFLCERYPCLGQRLDQSKVPCIDNFYLDLNGIIHCCSHPDDSAFLRIREEKMFSDIMQTIEFLFINIKPRKLFFLAVDGVAPRAKMNQQRGRRFRTAREIDEQEKNVTEQGLVLPTEARFDSNCITPGTVFMDRLHEELKYFVVKKISTDHRWQACTVILSGHDTPGEGEHKIMDYIRYQKTKPDWDPNTKHCLYGLDADLIVLGLSTHDPNFFLLREETYLRKKKMTLSTEKTSFFLLHLSLLRDYLDLEFKELKTSLRFHYDIERIIDDWILIGFLVGNDFIPNLPNLHIGKGALPVLYETYKEVLPKLDGYIVENANLNLSRFQAFLARLAELELRGFKPQNGEITFVNTTALEEADDLEIFVDAFDFIDSKSDDQKLRTQFQIHKKLYYLDKMDFDGSAAKGRIQSLAEDYVKTIQWILSYYLHGCPSWSWYYPYHYAPYISDIKNFGNLDLSFEKGEPFLPFHQLLAVLPPRSKNLLPEAYQSLLTDENSPIIDFYPSEFECDLNGKNRGFECVVLLPFIDEKRLIDAMIGKLSMDEQRRNIHGKMLLYTYSTKSSGVYRSPGNSPEIGDCYATVREMSEEDLNSEPNEILSKRHSQFHTPGLTTLKFLPFDVQLKPAGVHVFNGPSLGDNMILKVKKRNDLNAAELVGRIAYVGWPYMVEAMVNSVLHAETDILKSRAEIFRKDYMERLGIDVGHTEVLVSVKKLQGVKYNVTQSLKISPELVFSTEDELFPLQIVVEEIEVPPPTWKPPGTLKDLYSVNLPVGLTDKAHFGTFGSIVDNSTVDRDGMVTVKLNITKAVYLSKAELRRISDEYMNCHKAGRLANCSGLVFVKITGHLRGNTIGLNLKFNSRNLQVPGYTKKENGYWLYSTNTVELVRKYLNAFPELESFYQNKDVDDNNDSENVDDIFGKGNGEKKKLEIAIWLDQNQPKFAGLISTNSRMLSFSAVAKLEDEYQYSNTEETAISKVNVRNLFTKNLVQGNTNLSVECELLDRVACCTTESYIPFGLQGHVIAISKGDQGNPDSIIILFDKPFPGGSAILGCKSPRVSFLSPSSIINITKGTVPSANKVESSSLRNGSCSANELKHRNAKPPAVQRNDSDDFFSNPNPSASSLAYMIKFRRRYKLEPMIPPNRYSMNLVSSSTNEDFPVSNSSAKLTPRCSMNPVSSSTNDDFPASKSDDSQTETRNVEIRKIWLMFAGFAFASILFACLIVDLN